MSKFKIGDRVIARNMVEEDYPLVDNKVGTVVKAYEEYDGTITYAIKFDEDIKAWGDERLDIEDGHGLYVCEDNLEPIEEKSENLTIPAKVADESVELPKYETDGAVGLDLKAYKYSYPKDLKTVNNFPEEGLIIKPMERLLIKTGLSMAIPQGYEAQLRPRSGLSLKNGIMAILGTIDSDYRGDIGIILANFSTGDFVIHKGDRLGQLVFNKVEIVNLEKVDELDETKRGEKGFNSTGTK